MFNEKDKKLLHRFLKTRRTIRKFLDRPVPKETIAKIIETATWAPSAHNAQPWRFLVINDEKSRELAEAMAMEWEKDLVQNGMLPEERETLIRESIRKFTQPPVIIIAFLTMDEMHKYPDKKRREAEYIMAVQSVAAAIQNLLLAAYFEGLGACWYCAPLFCPETVKKVLGVPKNFEPQALITVGYPSEKPEPPPRKPLEAIMRVNRWE